MSEKQQRSARSNDPLIGKQLGDYRITSRLASGGMARIYKAMDYKLQRPAAVKVLNLERFEIDNSIYDRFKREARAAAALDHEHIIDIYQYGEDETEGVYFLAMKLITGQDLAHILRDIRKAGNLMPAERGLNIMTQIASAVDYAHSQGIIHRDLKPSNILIDSEDKATLTDLGLVLRPASETTLGTAFGTPRYIAPEQATSSDQAVNQSDVYALGIILYEILTGQTPFDGSTPMEIALAHISEPPPPPRELNPSIPVEVERALLKALSKDPRQRHETATELVNAVRGGYGLPLKEASSDDPTAPNESIRSQINKPAPRRYPIQLIALVAVILLIAAAFIINGLSELGGSGPVDGAPVLLIYDDSTFTIVNQGDYPLHTQDLKFVRGVDDNTDDFSGDRIPRDMLPTDLNCFQIILTSGTPTVPPQCLPIANHRQGQETLTDPLRVPWRSETPNGSKVSSFEVRYEGRLVTRCDTVARGENAECRFTWPVSPDTTAKSP